MARGAFWARLTPTTSCPVSKKKKKKKKTGYRDKGNFTNTHSLTRSLAHSFHHSGVNLVMYSFVTKALRTGKNNLNPTITVTNLL